jgi:hypothetical protein
MSTNTIVFGWKQSIPGRETLSGQHFQEFLDYLQQQKSQGMVESFEPVLLEPHSGELHGFFFIKGEPSKLATLVASPEWVQHQVRAMLHMTGMALMRGVTGPAVMERMGMWMKAIPK